MQKKICHYSRGLGSYHQKASKVPTYVYDIDEYLSFQNAFRAKFADSRLARVRSSTSFPPIKLKNARIRTCTTIFVVSPLDRRLRTQTMSLRMVGANCNVCRLCHHFPILNERYVDHGHNQKVSASLQASPAMEKSSQAPGCWRIGVQCSSFRTRLTRSFRRPIDNSQ